MPSASAITASNWFATPKIGHSELIPPSGSITPWYKNQPHAPTNNSVASTLPVNDRVCPSGFATIPSKSCTMNRPTRVPASIVVRMNNASNMIAK